MKTPSKSWLLFAAAAVAIAALVVYLINAFPEALSDRDGKVSLTRSLMILAFVGASLFLHRGIGAGRALRYAAIWVALGAVLVLGYSFRHEAAWLGDRLLGELIPHRGQVRDGAVVVTASEGGHFVIEAEVDGRDLRFLVDTGASDVVLSPADARRLGLDPATLKFTRTYRTANGLVQGAPVRLGRIAIGPIAVDNVRASVNGAEMRRSLLGMSFLNRLSGYEVRGGRLILRP